MTCPSECPLFRMLWCVSVAPLGLPVVPLVYWMLIGSSVSSCSSRCPTSDGSTPAPSSTSADHTRSRWPPAASPSIVTTISSLGRSRAHRREHLEVVGGLEGRGGDEHPHAGLAERVRELARPVRRVDVDEDRADTRGGELQQRPLDAGRRPDADPVALLDADGQAGRGRRLDFRVELPVRQADALVSRDEGVDVGLRCDDLARARRRSCPRAAGRRILPSRTKQTAVPCASPSHAPSRRERSVRRPSPSRGGPGGILAAFPTVGQSGREGENS